MLINFWITALLCTTIASSVNAFSSVATNNNNIIKAAVVVPGFLSGADQFRPMVESLNQRGIRTVVVPMPNWHWFPCLGARSLRPVLERIDYTVRHLCAQPDASGKVDFPPFDYSAWDFVQDMWNNPGGLMKVGGSDKIEEYPVVEPRGSFPVPSDEEYRGKIAIIGHSAGGWISRVYLSNRNYGGRAYRGSRFVHSLVTLGTPNADGVGPAFEGINWCNREPHELRDLGIKTLAVGGQGFRGDEWDFMTRGSYAFCCPHGTDGTTYDGDGITPIQSALALQGADHLTLDGVTHFPWGEVSGGDLVSPKLYNDYKKDNGTWYGSEEALDQWAHWLHA